MVSGNGHTKKQHSEVNVMSNNEFFERLELWVIAPFLLPLIVVTLIVGGVCWLWRKATQRRSL